MATEVQTKYTTKQVEEIFFLSLGMSKAELANQLLSPDDFERHWAETWLHSYSCWMKEYTYEEG